MLEAGVAKVCITPPIGAPLAGFAARHDACRGVHDDLYARALVLRGADVAVAFVAVDLLGLAAPFVERVRNNIARKTPLAPDAVMIACTHTHAGPVTITTFFNPEQSADPGYMDSLAAAIEQSVENAWRDRFPAAVGTGSAAVTGIAVNRRSADGKPVDTEAGIVRIDDHQGNCRAVVMNCACHPTVLGPDNLLASGDFPAAAIARIESCRGCFALFVNGAEGDVSVGHSSELSAIGVIAAGRTFERAAELGNRLADRVLAALDTIAMFNTPVIRFASAKLELPWKHFPSGDEARADLERARIRLNDLLPSSGDYRQAQSDLLYASITNFYAAERAGSGKTLPVELQAIRIGDAMFVAVPAEVFVELGLTMKRNTRRQLFLVGLANAYIGYLPDRSAYTAGGYEVISAKVDETAGEQLTAGVLDIEGRLFA